MSNTFNQSTFNAPSLELSDSSLYSVELMVKNINITELFRKFRKRSIAAVENDNNLNSLRILHFDNSTRKALKSFASKNKPKICQAPAKAAVYCQKMENYDEDDEDDEDNDDEDDMMSMVRDLAKNKKKYRASAASSSEATFTDKHLLPAIQRVLLRGASEDVTYAMIDKPDRHKKKPDIYFFFVEIKRPDTTSKYQPEDDFVKLMKQMKSSLCDQLCFGVANPTSLGLLMKVIVDGIYMPVALKRFSLVEEPHELVHLPAVVEALCFVKDELGTFPVEVQRKRKRPERNAGKERVYL
ncbi:hypothetical protein EDC94DRAFT_640275, partial [Helicostylum pulchrum]